MIQKSILIGNGINVEFSKNDDYKNYKIIERLVQNVGTEKYNDIFQGQVNPNDLQGLIVGLNDEFKKMLKGVKALQWTENEDEMRTLVDIARRYNKKPQDLLDVGMEDYFFVMKIFNNRFKEDAIPINSLFCGLKWLFLDSIYNDGEIETLYLRMDCYKGELQKYKNVFTMNYDTNLDKLLVGPVFHLHGSFDTLDDTYRPETILGYLAQQKDNPPKVIPNQRHIFCNGIMGFSGDYKMNMINVFSNGNFAMDALMPRMQNPYDVEAQQYYDKLKNSTDQKDIDIISSINARFKYPTLRYTEYPIEQFKTIEGELHIIGMSPNNDSHIFKMINENRRIMRVVYYSASMDDEVSAQRNITKPVQIINVFKYWKSIMN